MKLFKQIRQSVASQKQHSRLLQRS